MQEDEDHFLHSLLRLGELVRFEQQRGLAALISILKEQHDLAGFAAALRSDNNGARYLAARALGEIGDARVCKPLIAALRDAEVTVRGYAALALEYIGEPAVEPLIAFLQAADASIERATAETLVRRIREEQEAKRERSTPRCTTRSLFPLSYSIGSYS